MKKKIAAAAVLLMLIPAVVPGQSKDIRKLLFEIGVESDFLFFFIPNPGIVGELGLRTGRDTFFCFGVRIPAIRKFNMLVFSRIRRYFSSGKPTKSFICVGFDAGRLYNVDDEEMYGRNSCLTFQYGKEHQQSHSTAYFSIGASFNLTGNIIPIPVLQLGIRYRF